MLKFFKKVFNCEVLGGLYIALISMGVALIGLLIGIGFRVKHVVSDKLLISLLIIFAIVFIAEFIVGIIFARKFRNK